MQTYYSDKESHGFAVLRSRGKHVYATSTLKPRSILGFQNLLHLMCKQADLHRKALLIDISSRESLEYMQLAKLFAFETTDADGIYLRRPQINIENIAVHLKYFIEDHYGRLQPTVNEDKATLFVVSNAYGEHLIGCNTLSDAQLYLENNSAEAYYQKDKTPN